MPDFDSINARRPITLSQLALLASVFLLFAALCTSVFLIDRGADFENYSSYFDSVRERGLDELLNTRIEPLFAVISMFLVTAFSDNRLVYLTIAALAFSMKAYSISSISTTRAFFSALMLFYVFRYFPLHELTQIRIAVALGFVLLAITFQGKKRSWLFFVLGTLSHFSTLIIFPLFVFVRTISSRRLAYEKHQKLIWITIFVTVVAAGLLARQLVSLLMPYFIVLQIYETRNFGEVSASPFGASILLDIAGILTALFFYKQLTTEAKLSLYLLMLSIVCFYVLLPFPIIAFRVQEMLSLFWLFYLANALRTAGGPRVHAYLFIGVCSGAYFYIYFLSANAIFGGLL